jgi:hypothetical protein
VLVVPPASAARLATASAATPRSEAEQTLQEAEAVLSGATGTHRGRIRIGGERDATMVLTDLTHQLDALSPQDRTTARALLARPGYGGTPSGSWEHSYTVPEAAPVCGVVCIHYVTTTDDSVTDAFVAEAVSTMDHVWVREVTQYGYRAPRSDVGLADDGGTAQLDVYLQALPPGLYGYCVPDTASRVSSGYCVLDNDYSGFPTHTPADNLHVTAAHEFFHAVQFGYDSEEDPWLMEGTAAWMEDQVYDGVNDNRQYLAQSQLSYPFVPLDYSGDDYLPYGSWIFWRFLSEWAGAGSADDPAVVRSVWEAAAGPTYSSAALQQVLLARHTSFSRVFGTFGTWIREPRRYFSEGAAYPAAPADAHLTLTRARPGTGSRMLPVSHMSHSFVRLSPGSTLTGPWRVRVWVNMADTARGSSARVVVHRRSGSTSAVAVPLDTSGAGSRVFDFRRADVANLELDLVNASIRFRCHQGTAQSCGGLSYDDNLGARFSARAIR